MKRRADRQGFRRGRRLAALLAIGLAAGTVSAEPNAAIRLRNGDVLEGLLTQGDRGAIHLRPRWTTETLTIPSPQIRYILFPDEATPLDAPDAVVETRGGDRLSASSLRLENGVYTLTAPWGQRLHSKGQSWARLRLLSPRRVKSADLGDRERWTLQGSGLHPDQESVRFAGQVVLHPPSPLLVTSHSPLPNRFLFDIELHVPPGPFVYRLYFFLPEEGGSQGRLYLQVSAERILARWTGQGDDGKPVTEKWVEDVDTAKTPHRLRLFGDRKRQRLAFVMNGAPVHSWRLPGLRENVYDQNMKFTLQAIDALGAIRLTDFRLLEWDGGPVDEHDLPVSSGADLETLVFYDGGAVSGRLRGISETEVFFLPKGEERPRTFARDKVFEIHFSPSVRDAGHEFSDVRVFTEMGGDRLSGHLETIQDGKLIVDLPFVEPSVTIPAGQARLLHFLNPSTEAKEDDG